MDELIKTVSQKANISPEQAKAAVETVLDFLKSKLPAPISSQIDGLLGGNAASSAQNALGGLFGKK